MWRDPDRHPFAPRPAERYAPEMWDAADNLVFRPLAGFLAFEQHGESTNVNALDEVPDSSWFVNRIGRHPMTARAVARGACADADLDPQPPWRVVGGKNDGAGAGFEFEDAAGRRYVLKADRPSQPEQTTAADAIGAALYHAVGYHVPCNRVVRFEADWLVLDPDARLKMIAGIERDMTEADLTEVIAKFAPARGEGHALRGLASRYLDGTPLGPWSYRDVWPPDLNDVVAHEDRRELRGMRVLNAWVDHWDARQQNTLSTWISIERAPDGAGYVRHNLVDFGDILGFIEDSPRRATRFGYSQWLDTQHILEDFLTFGIPIRPWDAAEHGPTWPILGYYDAARFEPAGWRPNYWNGAFELMTERDAAWMARIIARLDPDHLRALIALGEFSDPDVERRLYAVMRARQQKVLERYLDRLSPLSDPEVRRGALCLVDLAVRSGLRQGASREDRAEVRSLGARTHEGREVQRDGEHVCVPLETRDREGYRVVRLHTASADRASQPVDLHLRDGAVVGLVRDPDAGGP